MARLPLHSRDFQFLLFHRNRRFNRLWPNRRRHELRCRLGRPHCHGSSARRARRACRACRARGTGGRRGQKRRCLRVMRISAVVSCNGRLSPVLACPVEGLSLTLHTTSILRVPCQKPSQTKVMVNVMFDSHTSLDSLRPLAQRPIVKNAQRLGEGKGSLPKFKCSLQTLT